MDSRDLKKVNCNWLLVEIAKIKKNVESDNFTSKKSDIGAFSLRVRDDLIECDDDLWLNFGKIGDDYRNLQRKI